MYEKVRCIQDVYVCVCLCVCEWVWVCVWLFVYLLLCYRFSNHGLDTHHKSKFSFEKDSIKLEE